MLTLPFPPFPFSLNPSQHLQGHCKEDFADLLSALDKMRTDGKRGRTRARERHLRRRLSDRPNRAKYDPKMFSLSGSVTHRNATVRTVAAKSVGAARLRAPVRQQRAATAIKA